MYNNIIIIIVRCCSLSLLLLNRHVQIGRLQVAILLPPTDVIKNSSSIIPVNIASSYYGKNEKLLLLGDSTSFSPSGRRRRLLWISLLSLDPLPFSLDGGSYDDFDSLRPLATSFRKWWCRACTFDSRRNKSNANPCE